ncbi:tetratricopeptide repeat protein [Kitasatospora sp. NPDC004240]
MDEFYRALRELKQAAKAARDAAGQPWADREAERQVHRLNSAAAKKFNARRINEWTHDDQARAKVPSPASAGQFIALVTVWSAWAGRRMDERAWRTLLDNAQPNRSTGAGPAAARSGPERPELPKLRPLPLDFTGRDEELKVLLPLVDPAADGNDPVLVASVAGMGGIGKTTLALALAHEVLERGWFTGTLFIDLHGYDETPTTVGQALDTFLRTLGVDSERIPPDDDTRAALFRAQLDLRTTGGRGILVVADNASASEQVQLLLPGPGPHRLLVTSRHTLTDIGAELVDLDVLTPPAAVDLVERKLRTARRRPERVTGDHEGALRLGTMCGHLPLALELAAAQLVRDPHLTPGRLADDLAEALAETGSRLDQLDDSRREVIRASLDRSRRLLSIPERELLDLLAIAPGTDISTDAAAALTGQKPKDVRRRLADLAATGLLRQSEGGGRWVMHDLVRDFAREHAEATGGGRQRECLNRLFEYYLTLAEAANNCLQRPHRATASERFRSSEQALAWFDAEYLNIVAAVHGAYDLRMWRASIFLGTSIGLYMERCRHLGAMHELTLRMIDASREFGDRSVERSSWALCGAALFELRRFDEAVEVCQKVVAMDDRLTEGMAWSGLGAALHGAGRLDEALEAHLKADEYLAGSDQRVIGGACTQRGLALRDLGRLDEALDAYETALAIDQKFGDLLGEGTDWTNIGNVLRAQGKYEQAAEAGRKSVRIFRELAIRYREAHAQGELADTLEAAGHPADEVRELREQASQAYASVGELDQAAKALTGDDYRL